MNVLAIDTSTDRAVLVLATEEGRLWEATTDAGRRHGRDLLPRLKGLLEAAGQATDELGAIAVGLGPGSYTGLRVGVTAAKTLAYITGAELVGFDSLQAIARRAPATAPRVSVIADAQRGELYVADLVRAAPGAPWCRWPRRGSSRWPHGWMLSRPGRWCWARRWNHRGSARRFPTSS